MPAVPRLTRRARADLRAAALLALAALTVLLPVAILLLRTRPLRSSACRAIPHARASLYDAVLSMPRAAASLAGARAPDERTLAAAARARAASARLHALVGTCGDAGLPAAPALPDSKRAALEFATLSRYPIDGVLQYILGLIGVRSGNVVELDGASGAGVFYGSAALAAYNGFNALVIFSLWSGFNQAQSYYEDVGSGPSFSAFRKSHFPDAVVRLDEGVLTSSNVNELVRKNAYGGDVDVLFAVLDGAEFGVWDKLSAALPRVVVVFYQDYWGATARVFRSGEDPHNSQAEVDGVDLARRRLYVGASLAALVDMGALRGYGLAWCLRAAPIAIFVSERDQALPTISAARCLAARKSKSWQRDMEAQWHAAQRFAWTNI